LLGAVAGAWLAHAMFDMNVLQFSTRSAAAAASGWPKLSRPPG
jgi:hypothetical protein